VADESLVALLGLLADALDAVVDDAAGGFARAVLAPATSINIHDASVIARRMIVEFN
jgi:hypothetical protein